MYSQITSNKRKTAILIILFIGIVLGLGWLVDQFYGSGSGTVGLAYAAVVSLAMTMTSYFHGDRLALWTAGAVPTERQEHAYLHRMIENLAITAGIPTPKIYLIPDQAINAFATGRDPGHASIAVTTGAVEKLENEELEGVLAHELSHIKNYDIRIMTMVIVLVGTISLIANWFLRTSLHRGRDRDRALHPVLLIVGIVLIALAPLFAEIIKLAVSRKREYLADASGSLLTRFPEGLARALQKISQDNLPLKRSNPATAHLFFVNPFGASKTLQFVSRLFSTHPPLEDRIKLLREMGI